MILKESFVIDLPLFPLGTVLLPSGRLPLQIFERRYIDMITQCMRTGTRFGVVWIRSGSEVSQASVTNLDLGDYGTMATIVDWDQLPNGLLGITIEGAERFHISEVWREKSGLNMGRVEVEPRPNSAPLPEIGLSMVDVLAGLQRHPEIQKLGLAIDTNDAWQVSHALIQLLPIESSVKYELLGLADVNTLVDALDEILSELSG